MLPKKTEKVAIVGGGLRGMATANSLARKGYRITLLEATTCLGGWLRELEEGMLPSSVLEGEIRTLLAMPVTVEYGRSVPVNTLAEASALFDEGYEGVFVACASPLDALADGATLLTSRDRLLAGRRTGRRTRSSIYDLFDGCSAAITIDRLLQGVSVNAGREGEGTYETRLYTNLDAVTAAPPVAAGPEGYDASGASAEAARCIRCECNECVKTCGFLQKYNSNPRRYLRMVYNNLSIAMGNHDANGMINTCALCSQCGAICPNGLNMADVFLAARQHMVRSGKMPPSAHEFALLDMGYSMSDAFFLARHQPGFTTSASLFFPGCQLPASEPELVRTVYADLRARLPGGVGLMLGCCGVMAYWGGNLPAFEAVKEQLRKHWNRLGNPKLIAACPTCAATLRELVGIETVDLFAILEDIGLPNVKKVHSPEVMVLHHACGARHDEGIKQAVRELATEVGVSVQEGTTESPCCGYGGLTPFVSAEIASTMTDVALGQLAGTTPLLTYCVNCRDRFRSKGRDARHLLELIYPATEGLRQKSPTWSARQENRNALARGLLRDLWGEETEAPSSMELIIDADLERKIEGTHILRSDIAAAIDQAEKENLKLLDPQSGHFFTSHRPANVTFWVEYTPEGSGFHVYNAYCHRMTAVVSA
jgi:Fe-S oxidoreductase